MLGLFWWNSNSPSAPAKTEQTAKRADLLGNQIHHARAASEGQPTKAVTVTVPPVSLPTQAAALLVRPGAPTFSPEQRIAKLRELKSCYEGDCNYPKTDPKSYDFALGAAIKAELLGLTAEIALASATQPEFSETAREFLVLDDGHVKEGALELIATQPTSSENLDAILSGIVDDIDPTLIEQALLELSRYKDSSDQIKINESLAKAIKTGAPFVAETISKKLTAILNRDNLSFYQNLLNQTEPNSRIYENLHASLQSWSQ